MRFLMILLLPLLLLGCAIQDRDTTLEDLISKNKKAWQKEGIDTYEFDATVWFVDDAANFTYLSSIQCSVLPTTGFEVVNESQFSDSKYWDTVKEDLGSINDLFVILEEAVDDDADEIEVTFDSDYHYPRSVLIYKDKTKLDNNVLRISIYDFTPGN